MDARSGGRGNAEKRKTWALVLMGGGARGLAHIGVLDNAPVEAAKKAGASVTVLVDVHRHLREMTPGRLRHAPQIIQRTLDMAGAAAIEDLVRRADVVFRVPLDIDTLDFSSPEKIIRAGEEVAAAGLPLLKETLGIRRRS